MDTRSEMAAEARMIADDVRRGMGLPPVNEMTRLDNRTRIEHLGLRNPIIYAVHREARRAAMGYLETLEQLVLGLAQTNDNLFNALTQEVASTTRLPRLVPMMYPDGTLAGCVQYHGGTGSKL